MEGLIPMVYRAIKRSRTRSRYECLSAGAAQTYNIADFYVNVNGATLSHMYSGDHKVADGGSFSGDSKGAHRRRYSSVGEYSFRYPAGSGDDELSAGVGGGSKQLVRFRSSRMFSCLTGAT